MKSWRNCGKHIFLLEHSTPAPLLSLPCHSRAYNNAGQAASALHVMPILQVYQAKVLRDLHKWGPDTEMMQELQSVTDYALRAIILGYGYGSGSGDVNTHGPGVAPMA